jgi:hypothetical protein
VNSILVSDALGERVGFWRRQFNPIPTSRQMIFDVIFGDLMPLFCFYFDPGVVRVLSLQLGELSLFIYGFSALAIITLSIWLALGHRTRSLSSGFSGVLLAGAAISFSIGVVILPLTLIGILYVIGLLGFIPFITGFVYLRNGVRAIGASGPNGSRTPRVAVAVFSAVIAVGLPSVAQWRAIALVKQSIAEIRDQDSIDAPVRRIKRLQSIIDTDRIVRAYEDESEPARKERLGRAYKEITGEEVERRIGAVID